MALWFSTEDYDESEGRPHLDKNGIRGAEGSRRTKKLVATRVENLRFRSVSPQTNDDLSIEDSEEDPRCVKANDPTVQIRRQWSFTFSGIVPFVPHVPPHPPPYL